MSHRKNVLFILIDQLRADCLTGALAQYVDMPHLRALMADSTSFLNHYSVCSPCGPSRASLLTGQYAMNHRSVRNGTPLTHDRPHLAGEVRKLGYLPLLFGYTDIAHDPRQFHVNDPSLRSYEQVIPGFEEILEMRLEESWPWRADLIAKGYDVPMPLYPTFFCPKGSRLNDPAIYQAEDSDTAFLTNTCIRHLAARPSGWFAHLTYIRPHNPLVAPEPYNRMYDPSILPHPIIAGDLEREAARHPFLKAGINNQILTKIVEGFSDVPVNDENIAIMRSIYLGLVTEVDHHIGRVINFLKESGLYDTTLIVVSSDHGEMLGDHHLWGKTSCYDAAYHIPLIIRDPDQAAHSGTTIYQPTESIDIMPTILDLLGSDIPHTVDGRSLAPFLRGQIPERWRHCTYSELDFGHPISPTLEQSRLGLSVDESNLAILRTEQHTLVHFAGGLPQLLFDRKKDGEKRDISQDSGAGSILLDMSRQMLSHRMTHPEGRFSHTAVTTAGVQTAPYR